MQKSSNEKNSKKITSAVILVFILVGISLYATRDRSSTNTSATTPRVEKNTSSQLAPDFSLERLDGGTITLAEYRGRKAVVLDFWATWCPNCQRSMPKLNTFYEKYKDEIEVIGVNLREKTSLIEKTIEKWGVTFPIALDSNGSVAQAYGVRYTNFHVLIDKEGNIVKAIPGDISEADIKLLLD